MTQKHDAKADQNSVPNLTSREAYTNVAACQLLFLAEEKILSIANELFCMALIDSLSPPISSRALCFVIPHRLRGLRCPRFGHLTPSLPPNLA